MKPLPNFTLSSCFRVGKVLIDPRVDYNPIIQGENRLLENKDLKIAAKRAEQSAQTANRLSKYGAKLQGPRKLAVINVTEHVIISRASLSIRLNHISKQLLITIESW